MPTISTKTVKPGGGGDYVSLNTWDVGERKNLVTADQIARAECYSGGNLITANFSVSSAVWVTDATRYIDIVAAAGNRHAGIFTTAKAYIQCITVSGVGLTFTNKNVKLRQMQVQSLASTQANGAIQRNGTTGDLLIDECIVRYSVTAGTGSAATIFFGGSGAGTVTNTISSSFIMHYGGATNGHVYGVWVTQQTVNCYASTLISLNVLGAGKTSGGVTTDNAASTITTDDCYMNGTSNYLKMGALGTINKGTSDATSNTDAVTAGLRNKAYSTANFTDITSQAEDLHIKNTSTLKWAGVAIVGVDFDIDGAPFHAPPSIGGDEIPLVNAHRVDNANLKNGEWNLKRFSSSVAARSASPSGHPYFRAEGDPNDSSSDAISSSTRKVRNYFAIPPSTQWKHMRRSVNGSANVARVFEDAIREYYRVYKHGQQVHLQGPMLHVGHMIPVAYVNPLEPKAAESLTYSNVANMNAFIMKLRWTPINDPSAQETDLNLLNAGYDGNNYIRLILRGSSSFQREWVAQERYNVHEPTLTIQKVVASSMVSSQDLILYPSYAGETPGADWFLDDTWEFEIVHFKSTMFGIKVRSGGIEGEWWDPSSAGSAGFAAAGPMTVTLAGYGYFGTPEIKSALTDEFTTRTGPARQVVGCRREFIRKLAAPKQNPIFVGDRDPTSGEVSTVGYNPYLTPDSFTRANAGVLGGNWSTITRTGGGWFISSNKANCWGTGIEKWLNTPRHADVNVFATVTLPANTNVVGVFTRFETGETTHMGYQAEIVQTSPSAATLRLCRFWKGTRTILASQSLSSYTSGTQYVLRLSTAGTTLTGTVVTTPGGLNLATASITDIFIVKPGMVGLYGTSGGIGEIITADDFTVTQNFEHGID